MELQSEDCVGSYPNEKIILSRGDIEKKIAPTPQQENYFVSSWQISTTQKIAVCEPLRMGKTGRFTRANPAKNVHFARANQAKNVHFARMGKPRKNCPFYPCGQTKKKLSILPGVL